jgi:hypothetical protein
MLGLDFEKAFYRVDRHILVSIDDFMMHAAHQHEVLQRMSLERGLSGIKPRPTLVLRANVAHLTENGAGGRVNDRRRAVRKRAAVRRQSE